MNARITVLKNIAGIEEWNEGKMKYVSQND